MTQAQVNELKRIEEEIKIYDNAITVFDINKHKFLNEAHREQAKEKIKKYRFGYLLECLCFNEKNHVRLNTKGFFGGQTVEVDNEFVDMCLEYFKKKRKALDDEFANL